MISTNLRSGLPGVANLSFVLGIIISYLVQNEGTSLVRESHSLSLFIYSHCLTILTETMVFTISCSLFCNAFDSTLVISNIFFIKSKLNINSNDYNETISSTSIIEENMTIKLRNVPLCDP